MGAGEEAPRKRNGRVDEKVGRTLGENERKKRNQTTTTRSMEQCRDPTERKRKRGCENTPPSKLSARRKLRMGIWARERMARRPKDDEKGIPLKEKSEARKEIENPRKSKRLRRLLCNYKSRVSPRLESGVRKKHNKEKVDKFLSLIKGINNVDVHNLWYKDKVLPFYKPESLSVEMKKTPWPVVLLVYKYNKKHVRLTNRL